MIKKRCLLFLVTCLSIPQADAQKISDRQIDELIGPVKMVRTERHFFDLKDGAFVESLLARPDVWIVTYDNQGKTRKVYNEGIFHNDNRVGYIRLFYDSTGNLVEETSGYNTKSKYVHNYDPDGQKIKTYCYENGRQIDVLAYEYESFDMKGNWTKRVITSLNPSKTFFSRTVEYREITYY